MTRKRYTSDNSSQLALSDWIRENLPDSDTGFMVSDLDFIYWNYKTRRLMLTEWKANGSDMRTWQRMLFKELDAMLHKSAAGQNIHYRGFYCIVLDGSSINDSVFATVEFIATGHKMHFLVPELIRFLSME